MDYKIILVYCLCADLLNALNQKEDVQCEMSDADSKAQSDSLHN